MTNRLATIIKNNGGHIHTNHPITALTHVRSIPKGPGIYKVDYWLSEATPWWTNPETKKSGTVHLGGTPQQMITAEQTIHQGKSPTTPSS